MSKEQFGVEVINNFRPTEIQNLLEKAKVEVLVGFIGGKTHVDTVHVTDEGGNRFTTTMVSDRTEADLARELHYGSSRTPARPFLDDGIKSGLKEIKEEFKKQLKNEIKSKGSGNFNKIGAMAVGAIQEFVRGDTYKSTIPNGPEWIETKGSDHPLIDGGDLINSVTYKVRTKR